MSVLCIRLRDTAGESELLVDRLDQVDSCSSLSDELKQVLHALNYDQIPAICEWEVRASSGDTLLLGNPDNPDAILVANDIGNKLSRLIVETKYVTVSKDPPKEEKKSAPKKGRKK
jgi:hypothetical protein